MRCASPSPISQTTDSIWDEAIGGHLGVGSTGEALSNAGAGSSPAVIADAVWDEVRADHVTAGTFGSGVTINTTPDTTQVALHENYGGVDALRYTNSDSIAIVGATIRVFTSAQWTAQALDTPYGSTLTNGSGRWTSPIVVPKGDTYYIQFFLAGYYGPDLVTVVVAP